jgi:hypothetical protein
VIIDALKYHDYDDDAWKTGESKGEGKKKGNLSKRLILSLSRDGRHHIA